MKWTTEAKVGAFSLAGIILFTIIIVHLSTLVIFGRSGFLVTGYFKEAEGHRKRKPDPLCWRRSRHGRQHCS